MPGSGGKAYVKVNMLGIGWESIMLRSICLGSGGRAYAKANIGQRG
jgi:hypothetical protein